jgi:hypothetical protein
LFIKELQFKVDCLSQQTKKETSWRRCWH